MQVLIALIPLFPLMGALLLGIWGRHLMRGFSDKLIAFIGCWTVGLSTCVCLFLTFLLFTSPPQTHAYTQTVWNWMTIGTFQPRISFRFDALAAVICSVISFVSFLIHLYSLEFMKNEEGY